MCHRGRNDTEIGLAKLTASVLLSTGPGLGTTSSAIAQTCPFDNATLVTHKSAGGRTDTFLREIPKGCLDRAVGHHRDRVLLAVRLDPIPAIFLLAATLLAVHMAD
jgi:hypothetical protein